MKNTKLLALLNALVILIVVIWNGYAGANGWNGNTVGGLSDTYANLFTPSGYAFSIWSLIFLGQIALAIHFIRIVFEQVDREEIVKQIALPLIVANLLNSIWLVVWLSEMPGMSVIVMIGILISLLIANTRNSNLEHVGFWHRYVISAPLQLYVGWIIVATVANFSAYLAHVGFELLWSEVIWTIVMIVIATVIIAYVYWTRQWSISLWVGVWALLAILVRHQEDMTAIAATAAICAGGLMVLLAWGMWRKEKVQKIS